MRHRYSVSFSLVPKTFTVLSLRQQGKAPTCTFNAFCVAHRRQSITVQPHAPHLAAAGKAVVGRTAETAETAVCVGVVAAIIAVAPYNIGTRCICMAHR